MKNCQIKVRYKKLKISPDEFYNRLEAYYKKGEPLIIDGHRILDPDLSKNALTGYFKEGSKKVRLRTEVSEGEVVITYFL